MAPASKESGARTWGEDVPPPDYPPFGWMGWGRVVIRGLPMAVTTFGGLALHAVVRCIERPIHGAHRPWTPWITVGVCRAALAILGLRRRSSGTPLQRGGTVVANHSSWLDIFVLNAGQRIYFVSKAEVAGWPGIGLLARATGTVFIRRDRAEAQKQTQVFRDRLGLGHVLLFFPEGTSTDGRRVLKFAPTLFHAFLSDGTGPSVRVQPVTVTYTAPRGADPRHYGWWGAMDFGSHLLRMLASPRQGEVHVTYHPPIDAADHTNRKTLALAAETTVRKTLMAQLDAPPGAPDD